MRRTSLACWTYGRSPETRNVIGDSIPPARRKRCSKEWRQLKRAFDTLLKPHGFPAQVRKARFAANTKKRRSITGEAQGLIKKCRRQAKAYAKRLKESQPPKKKGFTAPTQAFLQRMPHEYMDAKARGMCSEGHLAKG